MSILNLPIFIHRQKQYNWLRILATKISRLLMTKMTMNMKRLNMVILMILMMIIMYTPSDSDFKPDIRNSITTTTSILKFTIRT